jgi:hypothetical protein
MPQEYWPVTDVQWDQTEESYLKTASDDQKDEYEP